MKNAPQPITGKDQLDLLGGTPNTQVVRREKQMANDTITWLGLRPGSDTATICLGRVLSECHPSSLLLFRDKRLQIEVVKVDDPIRDYSVWAYFPVHRRRWIAKRVSLQPSSKVLLVLSLPLIEKQPRRLTYAQMRDHLGHAFLYLLSPKARNECQDAMKWWKRACTGAW
jgi:hypothetical protein